MANSVVYLVCKTGPEWNEIECGSLDRVKANKHRDRRAEELERSDDDLDRMSSMTVRKIKLI